MGGGLILIAVMSMVLPPPVIIPLHAVVQLISNGTRAWFGWQHIQWQYIPVFLFGAVLGALIATGLLDRIRFDHATLFIGLLILVNVWLPGLGDWLSRRRGEFFFIGLLQTLLGSLGGATGPLANSSLLRRQHSRDEIVTTAAVTVGATHVLKLFVYGLLGVSFWLWWKLLLGMCLGVTLGSWVGSQWRGKIDERKFRIVLQFLLTLLAVRMIWAALAA